MELAEVRPPSKRQSHLSGCVGFWLWALVGAAATFAFISVVGWLLLLPAVVVGYLLRRRPQWKEGPVLHGMLTGAGLPFLLVAALHWTDSHQRAAWGGIGICLVVAGIVLYAVQVRRA